MYEIVLYRDLSEYGERILGIIKNALVNIGAKYGIKTNLTVITVPIIEPRIIALNIDNHTVELNQYVDEKEVEKIILDAMSGNNNGSLPNEIMDLLNLVMDQSLNVVDAA